MAISSLGLYGAPGKPYSIAAKTPADFPEFGVLVSQFDVWREGYSGAVVTVYKAGTTEQVPLFHDIFLTQPASNPQILLEREDSLGQEFGKFTKSVYSPYPYYLDINTVEQTGVSFIPLYNFVGKDAGDAVSLAANGGSVFRRLSQRFADYINALDFGELGTSPTTNTATLDAAISAASTKGGGVVNLPSGVIPFNNIVLPANVILRGAGKQTTILQSEVATKVINMTGNGAGLAELTLDGINLLAGSIGVYGRALRDITFDRVIVKRFSTGIQWQGGFNHIYRDLSALNCDYCFRALGDKDFTNTNLGSEYSGLDWLSGEVGQATNSAIDLSVVDEPVRHNVLRQVDILDNVGNLPAVYLYGAAWTTFDHCYWDGNTINIKCEDNSDDLLEYHEVIGLQVNGGQMVDGALAFDGLCQDIIFDKLEFDGVEFQMNVPTNPVLLRDCTEYDTTLTGDTTKLTRFRTSLDGTIQGQTTDDTTTVVYKEKLNPNEVVQIAVSATAEQVNGSDYADIFVIHSARCAPATLPYDAQTVNFTVGRTIKGATSGATAIIVADSDSGSTGTLSLGDVSGTFVDNELITEVGFTGSARVNGSLTLGTVSLVSTATDVRSVGSNTGDVPAAWGGVGFAASQQEFQVTVNGAASTSIFWGLRIKVTRL